MSEESKVIRTSKGDQHIHLCVYLVDPSTVVPASSRKVPIPLLGKGATKAGDSAMGSPKAAQQGYDGRPDRLTMSPAEIRVIRSLSTRANVLPVIARADSLTDDTLAAIKGAVRTGLQEAGLDFGVFGHAKASTDKENPNGNANGNGNGNRQNSTGDLDDEDSDDEDDEPVRPSRNVVRLRPSRLGSIRRSLSRSRRDLRSMADLDDPINDDNESIANVRFSAHIVKKTDLSTLLPFALITPEATSTRSRIKTRPLSTDSGKHSMYSSAVEDIATDDGHAAARNPAYLNGPPDDLRGVFIRKFRWGTVDVLDPNHCDFAALRTAVLSTHLKARDIYLRPSGSSVLT
ncbi:hypothetical protein HWV62_279 [Athelia sp. TMB]|nr:hypothetical protein HWV62_279 [Athelia sp. TMB]